MCMHASRFAGANSFRWQTLTVSANIFLHILEIFVQKWKEQRLPMCKVSRECYGQSTGVLSEGSQREVKNRGFPSSCWSLERPILWHVQWHLSDAPSIPSVSPLEPAQAEEPPRGFREPGPPPCQWSQANTGNSVPFIHPEVEVLRNMRLVSGWQASASVTSAIQVHREPWSRTAKIASFVTFSAPAVLKTNCNQQLSFGHEENN